jgi:gliding motility-associated-like protein
MVGQNELLSKSFFNISNRLKSACAFVAVAFFFFPAQSQLTVASSYSGCNNQIITVTASWPNVSITGLNLIIPPGGSATNNGNLGTQTTFTLSHPTSGTLQWTLTGNGTNLSGPVTSTAYFNVSIIPPAPLSITNTANYCPGTTATIIAEPGGTSYSIGGPANQPVQASNVFLFGPLGPGHNGTYTVVSIGTCTMTGTTSINVAPSNAITVNTPSNVCQGGTVGLQANTTNPPNAGFNWEWSYSANVFATSATHTLTGVQVNQSGQYLVSALYTFGAISCPMTASTQVSVVQTNPVSAAASPANNLCQGDKLTLSAGAGGAVGFSWVGPASFGPITQANPTINPVGPTNAGAYSVTAFFTNNFISCTTTNVVNVQVIAVTVPILSMPSSVCQNTDVILSASAGTNVNGWAWFGPGLSSSNTNSSSIGIYSIQPNASGTYFATAKFGSLGSTTCAATASAQLNVVQVNSVTVIPPQPVCMPGNGYLFASAIGANAYSWSGPNGFGNPGASAIVYYPTPAASGIYTVTAFFGGGNITCSNSNTVQLTVNPALNFTLVPRQQTCYNSSLTVSGPSGANSYTWTSSTGLTSNSKDIFFGSIQPNNAGTYTLNVSLGPCVTGASTSIEVLTPIAYTLTPKSRTICKGDTTILETGITGGSENYAFVWNPALYLDSPVGQNKVVVPGGSVQYNIIAHDIACPHYTISHVFDINVLVPPQPTLELPTHRGCAPMTLFFNSKLQEDTASWLTTFDFGGDEKRQGDTMTYSFKTPGEYTVKIITSDTNGCSATYVHAYPITVLTRPGADLHWMPERPTTSDEITFHATVKNEPIIFHNWIFSGGVSATPDSIDISPGVDTSDQWTPRRFYHTFGKYPVQLIVKHENECIDTVVKFLEVIDDLQVFIPNSFTPNGDGVNDRFGVKGQGVRTENFTMDLSDRWGNLLFSTRDINDSWDGMIRGIKAHDGVYLYRVRVVGMNGEGRREFVGHFTLLK